jgi:hypothetical protein
MEFLSGPSKHVTMQMAQGVASVAMQIKMLGSLDPGMRTKAMDSMQKEGAPTTMQELVRAAASVVSEQKMGWLKRNQYLGAIQGYLVVMGMSYADAAYLKGMIEISAA